ncbi:male-enhanced antigen 1 [Galendromus occidentalis]|uniref:Male-enhanced antigen 1 n=1 Tax=Galendromus occidentalis TaxID=34638 RepID=A0AAJ6VVF1_9ACAR|nr:male-enhanced antigen 1 [Galendromus occidentalis]
MVQKSQSEENKSADNNSLERPRTVDHGSTDTDSEAEGNERDTDTSGYTLLPQSVEASRSDSEDDFPQIGDGGYMTDLSQPPHEWVPTEAELKPSSHRELALDEEQIAKIKTAMAGIKLPSSCQPPWASEIPEAEWNRRLQQILHKKQNGTE